MSLRLSHESIPIAHAINEPEILSIGPFRVDCFAAAVNGDLNPWTQMPQRVLPPIEMNRQISGRADLFQQSNRPSWKLRLSAIDPNALKIRQRNPD